jgi:hypothetical protein
MYTGLGGMSLRPVVATRVTSTEVCSRVTNGRERDDVPCI